jgi:hypothetical protein
MGTEVATGKKMHACLKQRFILGGSIRKKNLGHLTVSTTRRIADSQPDRPLLGCEVKSDGWETRTISRPAPMNVDQQDDDTNLEGLWR